MKNILGIFALCLAVFAAAPVTVADAPTDGRVGRAELRYMEGMIDHHQMAIDMALDCLAREDISDALRTECQNILDAQQPEIEQMQAWLLAWYNVDYQPMAMADMMMGDDMGGMDHGSMDHSAMGHGSDDGPFTDPAMMMGMFAGFNRLDGVDYEMAWLESMVDHHDDAIHMSERLLSRDPAGDQLHADLRALAEAIIEAQTAEMTAYEELLVALGG